MALLTTYNGWVQALPTKLTRVHVGGMSAQVRAGDVATVLGAFLADFHAEVEPIARLYGWRSIATNTEVGGDARSTHLSGTAVDVNGHIHPWEKRTGTAKYPARGGFTTKQLAALRKVLARYDGAIGWGGDYPRGIRDAMHFDIRANAADVAEAADRIRNQEDDMTPDQLIVTLHGLLKAAADRSTPTGRQVADFLRDIVWNRPVARGDALVPAIQELADAKTLAAQAAAAVKAQTPDGAPIDTDALAAAIAAELARRLAS